MNSAHSIKRVSWIIENITRERSLTELAEAVKKAGSELFKINDDYTVETIAKLRDFCQGKTVVLDGSLNMSELITKDVPAVRGIGTPENYMCSVYYPKCDGLLFNDRHAFMPLGDVPHNPRIKPLSAADCVFIRPDAGQKQFQAGLFELKDLPELTKRGSMNVVVSTPKNISGEWRFICGQNGIAAMSSYRIHGKPIQEPKAPEGAIIICNEVWRRYKPDVVFVVDVCADNDGNFWLLELNQFTGAGLYACDKLAIVRAVESAFD